MLGREGRAPAASPPQQAHSPLTLGPFRAKGVLAGCFWDPHQGRPRQPSRVQDGLTSAWQNHFHSCLPVGSGFGVCLPLVLPALKVATKLSYVGELRLQPPCSPATLSLSLSKESPHCASSWRGACVATGCHRAYS